MQIAENQAAAGRREEARALFSKAIDTARQIKVRDELRNRRGDFNLNAAECLRTIAYVQARAGFTADALSTADSIKEPKWKNSALSQIAPCMAKQGQIKPALELAQKIDDGNAKNAALEGIALAQSASGDLAGALEWVRTRPTAESQASAVARSRAGDRKTMTQSIGQQETPTGQEALASDSIQKIIRSLVRSSRLRAVCKKEPACRGPPRG